MEIIRKSTKIESKAHERKSAGIHREQEKGTEKENITILDKNEQYFQQCDIPAIHKNNLMVHMKDGDFNEWFLDEMQNVLIRQKK
ncbi:hypothetical protein QYM36_002819 [Artemia franciscana]|uniref:Uncharacterized protein n=1 Tax=Artemia franciscana TaxID=6661 RepID=A0AA88I420_ARTSF|nr:hypothetical protein QYM36_002819 [Artemia franciscana]